MTSDKSQQHLKVSEYIVAQGRRVINGHCRLDLNDTIRENCHVRLKICTFLDGQTGTFIRNVARPGNGKKNVAMAKKK
jgi:hypothetical protein